MRVLIVNTYYYPEMIGGAEHSVKKLAEQLTRMGVECAVLCTGDKDEDTTAEGVTVYRRRMKKRSRSVDVGGKSAPEKLIHRFQELFCPQNAAAIEPVFDAFRPDVIHTNGLYDLTPVVWAVARRRGIRIVHTLRDYYLMCPHVQLMRRGTTERCENPHWMCRLYRLVNRRRSHLVDVVTAPSQNTLNVLQQDGYFRKAEARVVVNAIDFDRNALINAGQKLADGPFTMIYLGELSEKKGLPWLLKAFEQVKEPDCRLLIAGRGALEPQIRAAAEKDRRIEYLGLLKEEGVYEALEQSDALVCPSVWEEPFGRVVIDAYKHGLPVIASDRGALPEIVEDGKTGFVVPAGDVEKLAGAMRRYAGDRALWRRHCAQAAEALQRFSLDNQAKAFMELYAKK